MNSIWFLLGLIGLGIGLISIGTAWNKPFLTALGGSLFGTAIGSLLSIKSNRDSLDEVQLGNRAILEAIRKSLEPDFRSDESRINRFRRSWHSYHVTKKDGRFIWHHSELNFKKIASPGVLSSEIFQTDKEGKMEKYFVTAGLREERLVMFFKGEEIDEPTPVTVYPFAGLYLGDRHCGLRVHLTWDRTDSISRAVLSKSPIGGWTQVGDVSEDVAKELDKIWEREFEQRFDIFPRGAQLANT